MRTRRSRPRDRVRASTGSRRTSVNFLRGCRTSPELAARCASTHARAREHGNGSHHGLSGRMSEKFSECIYMPTPIIAFSKDFHEDPTSNHHILRELAKTRRVLWLNSLATRTPDLTSARDLGKLKRKLREFGAGATNVETDLWVATPLVLPLPNSAFARAVNRQILRATIRSLRSKLG